MAPRILTQANLARPAAPAPLPVTKIATGLPGIPTIFLPGVKLPTLPRSSIPLPISIGPATPTTPAKPKPVSAGGSPPPVPPPVARRVPPLAVTPIGPSLPQVPIQYMPPTGNGGSGGAPVSVTVTGGESGPATGGPSILVIAAIGVGVLALVSMFGGASS